MSKHYVAFIRHGDYHQLPNTPSALQPFPLTDEGCQQASDCAGLLQAAAQQIGIQLNKKMHCSSSLRAWQTATIIRDNLPFAALELVESEALSERSVGALANLDNDTIQQIISNDPRYPELPENWKSDSHFSLPVKGAESLLDSGKRVANYLLQMLEKAPADGLTCMVGHGASIRHAAYHLGILPFNEIAKLSMYHASPVVFEYSQGHWQKVYGDWKYRKAKTSFTD